MGIDIAAARERNAAAMAAKNQTGNKK
jgi:hypothetical protein